VYGRVGQLKSGRTEIRIVDPLQVANQHLFVRELIRTVRKGLHISGWWNVEHIDHVVALNST
jgi:hypothetical protein